MDSEHLVSLDDFLEEEDDTKCCLCRKIACCRFNRWECGPTMPRWMCWSMCLTIAYLISIPTIFFLMHFIQYPGNIEGDFHIKGTVQSDFVANRSDGKVMQAHKVTVPIEPNSKQAPVVFFGGNAQGMSGAAEDAIWLLGNLYNNQSQSFQFQLYTTAYRGFYPNNGWVSEKALRSDAEDFLDHALRSTHGSTDGRVILGGWSMGAGVASQLAAARPDKIAGLILFSPWSSLRQETLNIAAPLSYLLYPYIWMCQVWDSLAAISSLPKEIPVAIISASADHVIPSWEHRKMYEASAASHKWWLPVPGAQHMDLAHEVETHSEELGKWGQASWDRIELFNDTVWNGTSEWYEMDVERKPFVFLGDIFAQKNELII